jgi:hypothetical protein
VQIAEGKIQRLKVIHRTPLFSQASAMRFVPCAAPSPAISYLKRFASTGTGIGTATATASARCGWRISEAAFFGRRNRSPGCLTFIRDASAGTGHRAKWHSCSWLLSHEIPLNPDHT